MSATRIPISSLKFGVVRTTHIRYFTGGIIAIPVEIGGYVVGPTGFQKGALEYLGPYSFEDVGRLTHEAGCYYVGCNEISSSGPARTKIWYPHIGNSGATEQSSDSWAGIAFQAREVGDDHSMGVARHISISVASASRRLRDVAVLLNEQLQLAVSSQYASGQRYSNIAIHDLYLAIHSFLSEMCSARDYLCQLAARRVGAKEGIDNLARLQNWLSKASNANAREDALIKLIQDAAGTEADPGWLTKLSDLRNQITHRQPLGASPEAAALLYQQVATSKGLVPRIRLARSKRGQGVTDGEDPFIELLRYWLELEKFSQAGVSWAPYRAEHPHFVVDE